MNVRPSLCWAHADTKGKGARNDERASNDSRLLVIVIVIARHSPSFPSTHLFGIVVVDRDDVGIPGYAHVRGRSAPGRQVVLERLQRVYVVVETDLARGRERPVKGVLGADVLVKRR